MHLSRSTLFIHLLGLVLVFCVCIGYGCHSTPEQKRDNLVKKYQKLSPTDKHKALCNCIHPEKEADTLLAWALIEAGADVNQPCLFEGSYETLWSLIGWGNPRPYKINRTATYHFLKEENIPLLDQCFKHGGTVDSVLIENTQKLETWKYLFSKGWTVNHFSRFDAHIAQDRERLEFLLAHGMGINDSIDDNGYTFFQGLSQIEEGDDTTMFAYLFSKGADINYTAEGTNEPIFNIVENKQVNVFRWMLRNGATTRNIKNNQGETLLWYIIENSSNDDLSDMVAALVEKGETESLNRYNNVEEAVGGRNYKLLQLLLNHGASIQNPDAMDLDKNAFEEAIIYKDTVSLKILLDARPREARVNDLIKECEHDREFWASDADYVQRLNACIRILKDFGQKRSR